MTTHLYTYPIVACDAYDGDSLDLTLDVGFGLRIHRKCRLEGVDTPELRSGSPEHRAAGRLARDVVRALITETPSPIFCSLTYTGKFGRPLGDVIIHDNRSLVSYLIERQYGAPYHGQSKAEVAHLHQQNIAQLIARGELAV